MPGAPAAAPVWPSEDGKASYARVPGTGTSKPAGFGKDKRIRTSVEFEALMRAGTKRNLSGFTFFYSARTEGSARLGILISKKHAALATDRNRIKRCIREAFRQVQGGLGAMDVLVRPPYGLRTSSETVGRLRTCLERLAK